MAVLLAQPGWESCWSGAARCLKQAVALRALPAEVAASALGTVLVEGVP
jgi:hypothetical protein